MATQDEAAADTGTVVDGENGGRERRRAARRDRSARRQERSPQNGRTVRTPAFLSLLTAPAASREEAEREAALEFDQAAARSMELLKAAVPEASTPEEALRAIESRLGPPATDPMPELPAHPQYQGDTLVYHQLRRHYGRTSPAGSFRRGWHPGP